MLNYFSENIKIPQIRRRETTAWIKSVAQNYGKKIGDISYIFCNDEKILEVNQKYLQHDYFTDVITFDYSENDVISGDIFISLETVKSNSEKYNTLYNNELQRVIIHGILHLCGLKDKTEKDEKLMREAENNALEQLNPSCHSREGGNPQISMQ
ncbi:MAG: rRNA maturation RNase YbeY [Prevotellaceae bacterium]|jgi:rRNA maturation RNase YbeY|nr:rRNA maturation RNase YbeY [Prevotellaceae bacterium]